MCHIGSRKAKIQPQMTVSGNADIFSIKVDSRLKTILIHTGVAPEMDFSSVPPGTRRHFDINDWSKLGPDVILIA